jgi:RibD C-terminal domain
MVSAHVGRLSDTRRRCRAAWLVEERADGQGAGRDHGADLIRQALAAGLVDELTIIIAPVTLGAGKRLFDGFGESLELEHLGVRQSPFATFIDYRVKK